MLHLDLAKLARRSRSGAICIRQLLSASVRSAAVVRNCIGFSASAKVADDASGLTAQLTLKAGGVPDGNS
jgi:hypothetical protein